MVFDSPRIRPRRSPDEEEHERIDAAWCDHRRDHRRAPDPGWISCRRPSCPILRQDRAGGLSRLRRAPAISGTVTTVRSTEVSGACGPVAVRRPRFKGWRSTS
jgi:hypothetical protein